MRARECAFFMAEELAFEEFLRQPLARRRYIRIE
jgi:hypothetical protein